MADILVRDVPEKTLEALKARARRHRRSLQQELVQVLEATAEETPPQSPSEIAAAIRAKLSRTGRVFSDSVELIREDRQR
ncbi:MAG: hypothetical protein HYX92_11460 [Chloroflexi bacterium]|nr:hypothetical protein [Chloroflexota bacterium]